MTENFKDRILELNCIGVFRICTDFYERPDRKGFVHSPVTKDRTRSLKLYDTTNSFCDFANGNVGGDIVRFVSYVQKIDNWQALKLLCDYYGLSGDEKNKYDRVQRIRQQEEQRRKEKEQKELKQRLWVTEADRLKTELKTCEQLLNSPHVKPMSDLWCFCKNRSQLLDYKLDCLCGIDRGDKIWKIHKNYNSIC